MNRLRVLFSVSANLPDGLLGIMSASVYRDLSTITLPKFKVRHKQPQAFKADEHQLLDML